MRARIVSLTGLFTGLIAIGAWGCSHDQQAVAENTGQQAAAAPTAPKAPAPAAEPPTARGQAAGKGKAAGKGEEPDSEILMTLNFAADSDIDNGAPPLAVKFTVDMYDDDVVNPKYEWNFGDGSPESHEASPTHTFTKLGHYRITLRMTDDKGRSGSDDVEVDVVRPEDANPTPKPSPAANANPA